MSLIDRVAEHADKVRMHEKYVAVFSTPVGQDVLRHICKRGFVMSSTFVPGDIHTTALNEGSRRLALSILRFVAKDPKELAKFVEELTHD